LRFWDTSALVPLLVTQPRSAEVERWRDDDPVAITWTLASVEIVSALQRLVRESLLSEPAAAEAELVAAEILAGTHVVTDVERVKPLAARLLRVHALRAADALQLGAALLWADGSPAGLVVHTFDLRLAAAAEREGFRAIGHR
jgi:predicted nucleic acid-binding protein